jgi:uncharacterized protein YndB with AHSA1/START domain
MKILKKILIGIAALVAIVLITALFVKKSYSVEREITINKPVPEVFAYVKQIKNQDYYSKWVMTDPNMKKTFKGTDATAGFVYAWDGNDDAGKGEQEIKKIEENKRIDMEIRFEKPMEGVAQSYMTTEAAGANQTKVKMAFSSKIPYPMNIMCLFIDNMLGKDMETSLGNLKTILEKQ